MQGCNWIRGMNKEKLISIKPTMDALSIQRALDTAITNGYPAILEDAIEQFDPLLDPLMGKVIEKKSSNWTIKLGDSYIEYNKDFRFFITTKLSKPHFAPEVCVKVTMLNFMVTEDGLLD
jgi:dynein heavy chain